MLVRWAMLGCATRSLAMARVCRGPGGADLEHGALWWDSRWRGMVLRLGRRVLAGRGGAVWLLHGASAGWCGRGRSGVSSCWIRSPTDVAACMVRLAQSCGWESWWFVASGSAPPSLAGMVLGGVWWSCCVRWLCPRLAINGSCSCGWWLAAGGLREVRLTATARASSSTGWFVGGGSAWWTCRHQCRLGVLELG